MIEPPTPTSRAKTLRKRIFTVVRVLVSVGLLVAVLWHLGVDNTIDALRGTSPWWVLVVLALMLLEGLHGTYKWLILLRHTDHDIRFWPLFRITYISGFVGMFLPGAVGIELVRMYGLAKQTSDLAMSFTSILMDRILGLTGLSLTILIGVMIVGRESIPGVEYWAGGALLLILAGWVAITNPWFRELTDGTLLRMHILARKFVRRETIQKTIDSQVHAGKTHRVRRAFYRMLDSIMAFVRDKQINVYQSLDMYRSRPGLLAWGLLQSLFYNGIRIAVCYTAGLAVGVEAPVAAYIVAVPVVIFVMLIPISVAGWGVRELMFVSLLTAYGADGDKVAAMSILVGLLGTVSILPGALFCMQGIGRARAELRGD